MKKIYIIALAALTLASCDNNDNPLPQNSTAQIFATIGESEISRAVDNSWTPGDQIGITSIVGDKTWPYINVPFITTNGKGVFDAAEEDTYLYFYSNMTLTAYYPFKGASGTAPGNGGVIVANTRPANQTSANQPGIDFLWDSKTGVNKQDFSAANPKVEFKFAHKMSKISFTFMRSDAVYDENNVKLADGVEVEFLRNYKIDALALDGTFDTRTGVCSPLVDANPEILSIDVKDVKNEVPVSPVIVFPQSLNGGSVTLHLYSDELNDPNNLQHYKCQLSFSNGEILPGYQYNYTIQVTKIGLIVGKMSVTPWVSSDRFITATIDGDKVFN